MRRRRGWYQLPRSGHRYYGPIPPGATPADPPGPPTDAELAEATADCVKRVRQAIDRGQTSESDRLLIATVHAGVTPTALLLAFLDHGVQPVEHKAPVGAHVEGHLPSDAAELVDSQIGASGRAAAEQPEHERQATKVKRARKTKASDSGEETGP